MNEDLNEKMACFERMIAERDAKLDERKYTYHDVVSILREGQIKCLEIVNAAAEADMLAGNPVSGAHHRAIEAELKRLRKVTP